MQSQKTSTLRNLFIFKASLLYVSHFFLINHTRKLFWHSNVNEPKRKNFVLIIITRRINFCIKYYFFPNRIKNFCPFRTDAPIKFHALLTLRADAARNRTIHETNEKIDVK